MFFVTLELVEIHITTTSQINVYFVFTLSGRIRNAFIVFVAKYTTVYVSFVASP